MGGRREMNEHYINIGPDGDRLNIHISSMNDLREMADAMGKHLQAAAEISRRISNYQLQIEVTTAAPSIEHHSQSDPSQ